MKKLLVTAFSALTVLLGTASVAASLTLDPQGAEDTQTVAAARGIPGLDGLDSQHNETLVRDSA
jgi:hypothetical protein